MINKTKLTNSIYILHGPNANVLVFTGNDGTLLVDTEKIEASEQINSIIKEITNKPIKFIINTHWHSDHTDGNKKLGEGAIIIAHDNVRDRLTTNQYDPFDKTNTPPLPNEALPIITYSENMTLYHNTDKIKIIHAPGHTDGDSIVFFTKNNILYLGDLIDDHEPYSINSYGKGHIDNLILSLEKAKSLLNNKTVIFAGHSNQKLNFKLFNDKFNALKDINSTVTNDVKEYITKNNLTLNDAMEGYNITDRDLKILNKNDSEYLTNKYNSEFNEPNPYSSIANLTTDITINRLQDNS